jgi:hypothetical protein
VTLSPSPAKMMGTRTTTRGNAFAVDAQGEAVLLSSHGQQVMMQWERSYMERCVAALRIQPCDRVLEIGFGLAYSATHIQTFRPHRHTIVECDLAVLERARAFASQRKGVEIADGTWQTVLPTLGAFDCVFFDDYPLPELEGATDSSAPEVSTRWVRLSSGRVWTGTRGSCVCRSVSGDLWRF